MAFGFDTKDILTQTLRLLCAVLMGSYFLTSCHCLPVREAPDPPCKLQHKTRHSRDVNYPVKQALEDALSTFENRVIPYRQEIENKLQNMKVVKNRWLRPKGKFFKELRETREEKLPEFHWQVQVYAAVLQKLMDMDINSPDGSFDYENRKEVLLSMKAKLNQLLEEIQSEICNKRKKQPEKLGEDYIKENWVPATVNHLYDALVKDVDITKQLHDFLKKCKRFLFGKKKKNGKKGGEKNKAAKNKNDSKNKQQQKKTRKNKKSDKS